MRKFWISFPIVALVLCAVASPGWAQGKSAGKGNAPQKTETAGDKVRQVLPAGQPVFTIQEITIIRDWFRINRSGLPPGLAKRETLPPGLEKQLQQKGTLPPGLQKKVQPFPIELERKLSVLPTGYRRVLIAGNVVLMNPETYLIYDIVRNVIP
ncbi:MAG: hypothetical protein HY313_05680 [Acidobacteria bacterium]|nr:hypothetical protein [Acidobacteriota bacterium]